jgi:F0F1-type ATP synthase assembly protein I
MQSLSGHSGDLSQDSGKADGHRTPVKATSTIDPAARKARGAYMNLSSASVGLEMGVSVIIGVLIGMWLDSKLGTTPWMMLLWLAFGFAAGFRGVLRAVKREDRRG